MGSSGQIFPSHAAPQLLRWEPRHWPSLFSRQLLRDNADHLLSSAVRRLDAALRRRQGIIEFTSDPNCILRLSAYRAEKEIKLAGVTIQSGARVGEIHFWNEHIPPMPNNGANICWGGSMRRRLRQSLAHLATFLENDPRFSDIQVIRGEAAFAPGKELDRTRCFASASGFEIIERPKTANLAHRLGSLGENIFLWGMVRTYNRGALRPFDCRSHPTWFQFWMTRNTLRQIYAGQPKSENK
jgi:hypothetical protein